MSEFTVLYRTEDFLTASVEAPNAEEAANIVATNPECDAVMEVRDADGNVIDLGQPDEAVASAPAAEHQLDEREVRLLLTAVNEMRRGFQRRAMPSSPDWQVDSELSALARLLRGPETDLIARTSKTASEDGTS